MPRPPPAQGTARPLEQNKCPLSPNRGLPPTTWTSRRRCQKPPRKRESISRRGSPQLTYDYPLDPLGRARAVGPRRGCARRIRPALRRLAPTRHPGFSGRRLTAARRACRNGLPRPVGAGGEHLGGEQPVHGVSLALLSSDIRDQGLPLERHEAPELADKTAACVRPARFQAR